MIERWTETYSGGDMYVHPEGEWVKWDDAQADKAAAVEAAFREGYERGNFDGVAAARCYQEDGVDATWQASQARKSLGESNG